VNARRRKHAGPGVEALGDPPDPVPEPIEQVCEGERDQALWRQFAQLSERCRTLLRAIAQASRPDYASIAEALDMPRGSIGPTRGRCLTKLRGLLLADPAWSTE
jgi:DNA-directed RNA polymerase specialized sigma24 family protein